MLLLALTVGGSLGRHYITMFEATQNVMLKPTESWREALLDTRVMDLFFTVSKNPMPFISDIHNHFWSFLNSYFFFNWTWKIVHIFAYCLVTCWVACVSCCPVFSNDSFYLMFVWEGSGGSSYFFILFLIFLTSRLRFVFHKQRQAVWLSMLAREVSLDLVIFGTRYVFISFVGFFCLDVTGSRFMGALQQGLVIVLLSRGPSGEVNVFPSSDLCILRGSPRWLSRQCGTKKCGTNQSAAPPFSILPNPLADQYQILLPSPGCGQSAARYFLSPTCVSLSSLYELSLVLTVVHPVSQTLNSPRLWFAVLKYQITLNCVKSCAVQCHIQNAGFYWAPCCNFSQLNNMVICSIFVSCDPRSTCVCARVCTFQIQTGYCLRSSLVLVRLFWGLLKCSYNSVAIKRSALGVHYDCQQVGCQCEIWFVTQSVDTSAHITQFMPVLASHTKLSPKAISKVC